MKLLPLWFISFSCIIAGCVTFAPPSPLMTYGAPQITKKNTSEAAVAVGTGAVLFDGAHSWGQGWFGRYKYGVSKKFDLGIDVLSITHSDEGTFTGKIGTRYQINKNCRLEAGIGAADDSKGKSLNSDLGFTLGTVRGQKPWNYYSTFRLGLAKGYSGNALFGDRNSTDSIAPPNSMILLLNTGAQAKISEQQRFIFEAGYGYLFTKGQNPAPALYISCGLVINIGKGE